MEERQRKPKRWAVVEKSAERAAYSRTYRVFDKEAAANDCKKELEAFNGAQLKVVEL